jgi:hypothetical protein
MTSTRPCSTRWATRPAYIAPIGADTIAKLVHNCISAVMGVALADADKQK